MLMCNSVKYSDTLFFFSFQVSGVSVDCYQDNSERELVQFTQGFVNIKLISRQVDVSEAVSLSTIFLHLMNSN